MLDLADTYLYQLKKLLELFTFAAGVFGNHKKGFSVEKQLTLHVEVLSNKARTVSSIHLLAVYRT